MSGNKGLKNREDAVPAWLVLCAGFGYLFLLFEIAYWGDKRADAGHSVVASPYVTCWR